MSGIQAGPIDSPGVQWHMKWNVIRAVPHGELTTWKNDLMFLSWSSFLCCFLLSRLEQTCAGMENATSSLGCSCAWVELRPVN